MGLINTHQELESTLPSSLSRTPALSPHLRIQQDLEEESLLRSINKNINEAIYRSVYKKGLIYVNDAFAKMFGFENAEEVINYNASELYDDSLERRNLGDEILHEGSVINKEVKFKRKDGSLFLGSLSSIKVIGEDGVIYFDGAIRDITAEKAAEKRLKYQYEMQKLLISISSKYINMPLDFINETVNTTLSELGSFLDADRIQINNYDFSRNESISEYEWCNTDIPPTQNKTHSIALDPMLQMVQRHFEGRSVYIKDVSALEESVAKLTLQAQGVKSVLTVPMMHENNCVGFVRLDAVKTIRQYSADHIAAIKLFANMSVNVTSRATDQLRLHKLLETTSTQNKRLKDFSYITSHNIRTSVANLIAINDHLKEDPTNKVFLAALDTSVENLNTSVTNINHLLNFDNKNEILEKKNCNVAGSIANVLRHNRQSINEKEISIESRIHSGIYVKAFIVYLDSIFHHIISNAIKYGTNEQSKQINITYARNQKLIDIIIEDSGNGIDLERYGQKLFKAGVRLHSSGHGGQGMGLFMCKYMIEAMGGQISVTSSPGKGASFTISLPSADTF